MFKPHRIPREASYTITKAFQGAFEQHFHKTSAPWDLEQAFAVESERANRLQEG